MGMFDYVQCDARLPVKNDSFVRCHVNPFQSKSVELWNDPRFQERAYNEGCLTITISKDNKLYDPDGNLLPFHGWLNFYSGKHEFLADCVHGSVFRIIKP